MEVGRSEASAATAAPAAATAAIPQGRGRFYVPKHRRREGERKSTAKAENAKASGPNGRAAGREAWKQQQVRTHAGETKSERKTIKAAAASGPKQWRRKKMPREGSEGQVNSGSGLEQKVVKKVQQPTNLMTAGAKTDDNKKRSDKQKSKLERSGRKEGKARGNAARTADKKTNSRKKNKKQRNTESFKPDYSPPDVRLVVGSSRSKFGRAYSVNDVVLVPELFCQNDDLSLYENLLQELKRTGQEKLFTLWHGDSHVIADDKKMGGRWKCLSPSFQKVVKRMEEYFDMDVKATRFNWYRNSDEWKPYHHDRAAFTPNCPQNITVAASFGLEREVSFLHARKGATLSIPLTNGSLYAFGKDVNINWKHGILAIPPERASTEGRISIIAWGWCKQHNDDR